MNCHCWVTWNLGRKSGEPTKLSKLVNVVRGYAAGDRRIVRNTGDVVGGFVQAKGILAARRNCCAGSPRGIHSPWRRRQRASTPRDAMRREVVGAGGRGTGAVRDAAEVPGVNVSRTEKL